MPEDVVTSFCGFTVGPCVNVPQSQQFIFDLYYWATGTAENYVLVFHPLPLLQVNLNHVISFNS